MSSIDPFGPSFQLTCTICLDSTNDSSNSFKGFAILPCNFGKERAKLIDNLMKSIAEAFSEGRQLSWLNEWMQIDPVKLKNSSYFSHIDKQLLTPDGDNNSKKLLTKEGYFNLGGLHGACQKCMQQWRNRDSSCHECRATVRSQSASQYLNQKIQSKPVAINRPISAGPQNSEFFNTDVNGFFDDVTLLFESLARSVIGGNGKERSEHLQTGMQKIDRVVSVAINGLIHNMIFHGVLKVTLLSFKRFGFRGLDPWMRLVDSSIDWNLSWAQHVLIWKAFVSAFNYSFSEYSVNLSYTALSHLVPRLDVLSFLWLLFKMVFPLQFGWSV